MEIPMEQRILTFDINTLRRGGQTDEEISAHLGEPLYIVKSVPLPRPQPVRQRAVQHLQLQRLVQVLMPKAEAGDLNSIHTLVKVMQREATLLGLDAPKETITHNANLTTEDLHNLSTETLKQMVLDQLEARTIDVTPTAPDPGSDTIDVTPTEPD